MDLRVNFGKQDMPSPFDYLNSINFTKQNLMEEHPESEYNPFMVNRGLSYFPETLLYAAELNTMPHLDKKLQYDFYLNAAIRKKKRFSKWAKTKKSINIENVRKYYGFSVAKATSAIKLLTEEQLAHIDASFNEGGSK